MSPASAALTVLGSGTLLPDDQRHSAAFLVEAPGVRLLLDCGPGTLHGLARHGVAWAELTHVAVTHYHTDHVGDFPALLFALKHGVRPPRTRPLTVVGPRGFGAFLERLAAAMGDHVVDPGFDLDVVELEVDDALEVPAARMRLTAHPTPHTAESIAYRVELPQGVVGYTGDTGPSSALGAFLRGCRLLVMECAQPDPPALGTHLSPETAARLAGEAAPGVLVLTHVFPPLTPAEAVQQVREAGYLGEVVAGRDGLRFALGA